MAVTEADVDRSMEGLSQNIARVIEERNRFRDEWMKALAERDEARAEIERLKGMLATVCTEADPCAYHTDLEAAVRLLRGVLKKARTWVYHAPGGSKGRMAVLDGLDDALTETQDRI